MINKAIDLWAEELSATDDGYQLYWNFLDVNEKTKATRFIQEKHRHYYVISHGKLRMILAAYTDMAPERICFGIGAFGKPFIVEEGKPHKVKFNLSHSDNRMVVAVGYYEHIGIDIEVWNDKVDFNAIAKECFAEVETKFWKALPDSAKAAAFYRFWTRKESFVKAVGAGITLGVSQVITSVDAPARFLSIPDAYGNAADWKVVDLDFGSEISVALTVNTNAMGPINLKRLTHHR